MEKIILSGIRASGRLHLGNFLGAVSRFVKLQEEPDTTCLFFVADLHALTTPGDRLDLRKNTIEVARDYLAAGLDPAQSALYAQSSVPEISELSLLLSMLQPLGDLQNVPTFKDKAKQFPNSVTLGLVTYPVLMAADILGPRATHVPVGKDQAPHLEMAAQIARRLNELARQAGHGEVAPEPEAMMSDRLVPGLQGGKMGKSDSAEAVTLDSTREEVQRLYKRAAIDPEKVRRGDPGKPDKCPGVFPIHDLLCSHEELRPVIDGCQSGTLDCNACKASAAKRISDLLEPFQERRRALEGRDDYVIDVLRQGAQVARSRAAQTLELARAAFGVTAFA